jgi:hypothetical protein
VGQLVKLRADCQSALYGLAASFNRRAGQKAGSSQ